MSAIARGSAKGGEASEAATTGGSSFLRAWLDRLSPGATRTRQDRRLKRLDQRTSELADRIARLEAALSTGLERAEGSIERLRESTEGLARGIETTSVEREDRIATELARVARGLVRMRKMRHREAHRIEPDTAIAELASAVEVHLAWIDQPLVLISQIQRSGGTLLSQLFDGHPECHAHPYELLVGDGPKDEWPEIDLASGPERWFDLLTSTATSRNFEEGYVKYNNDDRGGSGADESFPFLLPPWLQRELFARCVRARPPENARGVFDAYFTSYFHAWLNGRFREGAKRAVVAFRPLLASSRPSTARFFADYPDGHLVSVLRHPGSWWASARRHKPDRYGSLEEALALWRRSTEGILENKRTHGERVHLLRFEDLLGDTERTMRRLAAELGLAWSGTLLAPTFNGSPIRANSSFAVDGFGVLDAPAHRHLEALDPAEQAAIERSVGALHRDAERAVQSGIG
jgi:hypothetical protein